MNRKTCPNCDGYDTERVHTDWLTDGVDEVRICHACGAEYVNHYSMFEQEVTHDGT